MKVYLGVPPHEVLVVEPQFSRQSDWIGRPLEHIERHSREFAWGYGGSGPADLARSLLIDLLGREAICGFCEGRGRIVEDDRSDVYRPASGAEPAEVCFECDGSGYRPIVELNYQAFKDATVARWARDECWAVTADELHEALRGIEFERRLASASVGVRPSSEETR